MEEKKITRITIAGFPVGITGLVEAMEEIAGDYAAKDDEEVGAVLLRMIEKSNYIPPDARQIYREAFVREFHRHLGQTFTEESPARLDIKILGMGCARCEQLTRTVFEVLTELNLPGGVEHVTDIREIARSGVMGTPALLINDKPVAVGNVPSRERIKALLAEACGIAGEKGKTAEGS